MIRSIRTKVIISMMSLVILSGMFLGYVNYMDSEKLAIDIIKRNNKAELENINEPELFIQFLINRQNSVF